jgi:hypothetical protein
MPNKVLATLPDGTILFTEIIQPSDIVGGTTLVTPPGAVTLPDTIKFFNPYRIDWNLSDNNGATWHEAGQSDNRVYVTLATPITGTAPYETLYDIGARNADSVVAPAWAAYDIFLDFQRVIPGVKRKAMDGYNKLDGKTMQYWINLPAAAGGPSYADVNNGLVGNYPDLLNPNLANANLNGIGKCGAFAHLLANTWDVMGIPGGMYFSIWPIARRSGDRSNGLLVKNWFFKGKGSVVGDPDFKWKLHTDAIDQDGVAGQNVKNPPSEFFDHAIVKLGIAVSAGPSGILHTTPGGDDVVAGNVILVGANGKSDTGRNTDDDIQVIPVGGEMPVYDPSYGTYSVSEKSWENQSLGGIFKKVKGDNFDRARPIKPDQRETYFNEGEKP